MTRIPLHKFHRFRSSNFRWLFTDKLLSAATVKYALDYLPDERRFRVRLFVRSSPLRPWDDHGHEMTDAVGGTLRSLLSASDLAACAAASMVVTP